LLAGRPAQHDADALRGISLRITVVLRRLTARITPRVQHILHKIGANGVAETINCGE